jgi:hypothetical protein
MYGILAVIGWVAMVATMAMLLLVPPRKSSK